MTSIRTRLLIWLLSAVFLGAIIGAGITYQNVLRELESQFDYQLRQMALSLRDQGVVSPEEAGAIADEQMDFLVQVRSSDGTRIYVSRPLGDFPQQAVMGFSNVDVAGTSWRVFSVAARDRVVQVAQPIEVRRELAAQAALRAVIPIFGIAPLLAAIIWWSVGISLVPLRRIATEVKERGVNSLEPLSDLDAPVEVAPLIDSINALLLRLETSFSAQRNFVADAAHELRSPLTALKLQLELLKNAQTEEARRIAQDALAERIERATRLVEQLLTLARNEPGATDVAHELLDAAEATRLGVSDVVPLAADRNIELSLDAAVPVPVIGDAAALRILVRNLVNNAVRYSPRGGRVDISLQFCAGSSVLFVDDAGPGIPVEDRERIFDRFVRRHVDDDGADAGSGLGLAIVKSIANSHRATVVLGDSPLGGLQVAVTFPPVPTKQGVHDRAAKAVPSQQDAAVAGQS